MLLKVPSLPTLPLNLVKSDGRNIYTTTSIVGTTMLTPAQQQLLIINLFSLDNLGHLVIPRGFKESSIAKHSRIGSPWVNSIDELFSLDNSGHFGIPTNKELETTSEVDLSRSREDNLLISQI